MLFAKLQLEELTAAVLSNNGPLIAIRDWMVRRNASTRRAAEKVHCMYWMYHARVPPWFGMCSSFQSLQLPSHADLYAPLNVILPLVADAGGRENSGDVAGTGNGSYQSVAPMKTSKKRIMNRQVVSINRRSIFVYNCEAAYWWSGSGCHKASDLCLGWMHLPYDSSLWMPLLSLSYASPEWLYGAFPYKRLFGLRLYGVSDLSADLTIKTLD